MSLTYRSIVKSVILDEILQNVPNPLGVLQAINDKCILFDQVKICMGIIQRSRKESICGKDVASISSYCSTCMKKMELKSGPQIKVRKIGLPLDNYYWCPTNDHIYIYDPVTKKLTLFGVRIEHKVSTIFSNETIEEARKLGVIVP